MNKVYYVKRETDMHVPGMVAVCAIMALNLVLHCLSLNSTLIVLY